MANKVDQLTSLVEKMKAGEATHRNNEKELSNKAEHLSARVDQLEKDLRKSNEGEKEALKKLAS
eukprot:5848264-Karenia_brevis.AAC.1